MAARGARVLVAWEETTHYGDQIYYAASANHGLTFTTPLPIGSRIWTAHPDVAFTTADADVVLFEDDWSIAAARWTPAGFATPVFVGTGAEPALAAGDDGWLAAVFADDAWFGARDLWGSVSTDGGTTWTARNDLTGTSQIDESAPTVSADGTDVLVAWLETTTSGYAVGVGAGSISGHAPLQLRGTATAAAAATTRPTVHGGRYGRIAYDVDGELTMAAVAPDPLYLPGGTAPLQFGSRKDVTRGVAHARQPRLFAGAPAMLAWLDDRTAPGSADVFVY